MSRGQQQAGVTDGDCLDWPNPPTMKKRLIRALLSLNHPAVSLGSALRELGDDGTDLFFFFFRRLYLLVLVSLFFKCIVFFLVFFLVNSNSSQPVG